VDIYHSESFSLCLVEEKNRKEKEKYRNQYMNLEQRPKEPKHVAFTFYATPF
jgi:hypothetical protein